jgi:outer membrane protein TolC
MWCVRVSLLLLIIMLLAGCTTYTPLPLPVRPDLASNAAALIVPVTAFDTPGIHVTRINIAQPLDASAVAALAVLNNPALIATRAQHGVVVAQSYAAGLLPWPQIMLGASRPSPASVGLHNGWSLALGEDFAALLQHADAEAAAHADETRVRLDMVWDEWQVAQQARLLYAAIEDDAAQLNALHPLLDLYAERARSSRTAAIAGTLPRAAVTAAEAAYSMLLAHADSLQTQREKTLAALTGLLGLAPHTTLRLALNDHPNAVDTAALRVALAALPNRRPDLMAFAAGYRSADARLRQAVLAQFPLIGVSLNRKRDTEGVMSNGLSLTLNLPFLNGTRGQIAVASATRRFLHAAYQARLDSAVIEASALGDEVQRLSASLARVQRAAQAISSFNDAVPGTVPFDALEAYATQRMQMADAIATLRHALDETSIALETLLGMPIGSGHNLQATST